MNPIDLLEYCTCDNTIVIIASPKYNDDSSKSVNSCNGHFTLLNVLRSSRFQWMQVNGDKVEIDALITPKISKIRENLIIVSNSPISISSSILDYMLVFSTINMEKCFTITEDAIIDHISCWNAYPYLHASSTLPEPLRGSDGPDTFTGITMSKRIPGIIRQTASSIPNIPGYIKMEYITLAEEIQFDCQLRDVVSSSHSLLDTLFRVKVRRAIRDGVSWHSIPWWLAENYEYVMLNSIQRSIAEVTSLPSDPFFYLKKDALQMALKIFPDLVQPLVKTVKEGKYMNEGLLRHALLRNLWGNKADLSMSGGKVQKDGMSSEVSNVLLVDDVTDVWEYLSSKSLHHIAVFADNTGLELLCDLALIAILLHYYTDISITYVVKSDPVFVSDVTIPDIKPTLKAMKELGQSDVQWVVDMIEMAENESRLTYIALPFLCTASAGWEMPLSMAALLEKQDLMIGKGDANYRRLVGDLHWKYETPLSNVLEYYPCPLLLLRTLKSNVNVGIPEEVQERAAAMNKTWDCDGSFGIIQFYRPKHCQ